MKAIIGGKRSEAGLVSPFVESLFGSSTWPSEDDDYHDDHDDVFDDDCDDDDDDDDDDSGFPWFLKVSIAPVLWADAEV